MVKSKDKIIKIILLIIAIMFNFTFTEAEEQDKVTEIISNISDSYNLNEYISVLEEYSKKSGVDGISIENVAKGLISNKGIDTNLFITKFVSMFFKEVVIAIKGAITIFIIIIIMAIITSLELEKKSDITKIAHLACFLTLSTVTIATFTNVISVFSGLISTLTTLMQVISPFIMTMLVATGAITSTGVIQPLLLFLASAIGFLINYMVIPFFSISVALNVICSISQNLRLDKMSKMFPKVALWTVGISLTLFLGILGLESSLSSSVDSLTLKTAQTAMSTFVPVVGKFFSDSFETVIGATKLIGKTGGVIGIIVIILVSIVPILKIACISIVYNVLAALIEPIYTDDDVIKYISGFGEIYKTLLGILIGIVILFVISVGIILNLGGSIFT